MDNLFTDYPGENPMVGIGGGDCGCLTTADEGDVKPLPNTTESGEKAAAAVAVPPAIEGDGSEDDGCEE